jgi:uncharacterized protein (TIGR02145 family)
MKKTNMILIAFIFQMLLLGCSKNASTNDTTTPIPAPNLLVIQTNNSTANIIGQNQATIGGSITSDGGSAITARGICWNTSPTPTIANNKIQTGSGIGSFIATLSSLLNSTTYYARAYATTSSTTIYGGEITFTTKPLTIPGNGVTDVDGNTYTTVIIADKEWMGQNLRTTKYQNGDIISNVTTNTSWYNLTTGAWCYYNNSSGYNNTYGKLYNWYATTDARKISPVGWHVPSLGEWTTLESNFGANSLAGGALKQAGTMEWQSPNTNATNISNFTAFPGGDRIANNGLFEKQGQYGFWWTADEVNPLFAKSVYLSFSNGYLYSANDGKTQGSSIRCLKD